ncbi:MAG: UbiA family prenyltransferase [Candidatus Aenigmarchaeota archaeon]|nr:UbiA family prenyltransferase [Candidatus Aenigmarchaeota archaeon]
MKEFLSFIRFGICIFTSFLALTGYMLFNQTGIIAVFVMLESFLLCASVYSYNNITDKEEDLRNRKRINRYVTGGGLDISVMLGGLGLIFSSFLSLSSFVISLTFLLTGFAYSRFRIKKYCAIKNLYTALLIVQIFFLGTMRTGFDWMMIVYSGFFFTMILVGSLISDLRDYEGDMDTGFKTIPVVTSKRFSKIFIYFLIFGMLSLVTVFWVRDLIIFLPLGTLTAVYLSRDKYKTAHLFGSMGFIIMPMWLII